MQEESNLKFPIVFAHFQKVKNIQNKYLTESNQNLIYPIYYLFFDRNLIVARLYKFE